MPSKVSVYTIYPCNPLHRDLATNKHSHVIRRAKKRCQPEWSLVPGPEGWEAKSYATTFPSFLQKYLYGPQSETTAKLSVFGKDTLARVDGRTLTANDFSRLYDKPSAPAIFTHLQDDWQAVEKWSWDRLARKYGKRRFRVGDDNSGRSVKLAMADYVRYAVSTRDDSPLYIFDSDFGEGSSDDEGDGFVEDFEDQSSVDAGPGSTMSGIKLKQFARSLGDAEVDKDDGIKGERSDKGNRSGKLGTTVSFRLRKKAGGSGDKKVALLGHYNIPQLFTEDLLKYAGPRTRPPYKWFVMGPPRSGTGIHIDPLGTSAWNALVKGRKWWVLFPNVTPKSMITISPKLADALYDPSEDQGPSTSSEYMSSSTTTLESSEYSTSKSSIANNQYGTNRSISRRTEGIDWFQIVFPKISAFLAREKGILAGRSDEVLKPIVVLQRAGETIFVPAGWWHVVLNVDFTICVTQNFVSAANLPVAWKMVTRNNPGLARLWYAGLIRFRPDIAAALKVIDPFLEIGLYRAESYGGEATSSASETDYDKVLVAGPLISADKDGRGRDTEIGAKVVRCLNMMGSEFVPCLEYANRAYEAAKEKI